jgi:hypothetical protein
MWGIRRRIPSLIPRGGLVRILGSYPSTVYELSSACTQLHSHPISCLVGTLDAQGLASRESAVPARNILPVSRAASRTIVLFC